MEMVVSAKNTLQPGQCVVLERSGDYVNLRGVNSGFLRPNEPGDYRDTANNPQRGRSALQGCPASVYR